MSTHSKSVTVPEGRIQWNRNQILTRFRVLGDAAQREFGAAGVGEQLRVEIGGGQRPVQRGVDDRVGMEQPEYGRQVAALDGGEVVAGQRVPGHERLAMMAARPSRMRSRPNCLALSARAGAGPLSAWLSSGNSPARLRICSASSLPPDQG